MDRLYQIRRKSREMTSYSVGCCHICKQASVRVRRLNCGKHNYCRMCVEFVPRLTQGDFGCKMCSTRMKFEVPRRQDNVDDFMASKTGSCNENITFTTSETKLVALNESSDDGDLEGNNAEWDHLLLSFDEKEKHVNEEQQKAWISNAENLNAPSPNSVPGLISRKRSYVQLVPPSTLFGTTPAHTDSQALYNNSNHIAKNLRIVERAKERFTNRAHERPMPPHLSNILCRGRFTPDPLEIERGTSPCKGHRRNNSDSEYGDLADYFDPSLSETEQLREQIGDIEGPAFTSSSASESNESLLFSASNLATNVQEFEEFWDRK